MPTINLSATSHGLVINDPFSDESWTDIRSGSGTSVSTSGIVNLEFVVGTIGPGDWDYASRYYLVFDTSSIPDTATVTAATLTLNFKSSTVGAGGGGIIRDSSCGSSVTTADFSSYGTSINSRFTTPSGATNFSIPSSAISKTGVTEFAVMLYADATGSDPGPVSLYEYEIYTPSYGTTSFRPQLSVSYDLTVETITPTFLRLDTTLFTPTVNTLVEITPTALGLETTIFDPVAVALSGPIQPTFLALNTGFLTPAVTLDGVLTISPDPISAELTTIDPQVFIRPALQDPLILVPDEVRVREGGTGTIPFVMTVFQAGYVPADLTEATVKVYVARDGTYLINGTEATVLDALNGVISIPIDQSLLTAGEYDLEVELEWATGTYELVPSDRTAKLYCVDSDH